MSQLRFDANLLPRLEAMYRTEEVLRRRRLVRDAIGARTGEAVLDVGCGPGFYVAELLEDVGPTGRVVGVDGSGQMLGAAAQRTAAHANVAFFEADAASLPVEDAAFDAALCVQVLEYVEDTAAALAEMHRALRPGGRLVVWDVDWSTLSLHTSDPARTRRVLAAWDEHLAHPALPRMLAPLLRGAGFEDVRTAGHAFVATQLVAESWFGSLLTLVRQFVAGRAGITEDEAAAWEDDLRELGERGAFFCACLQFCIQGRR
ncbi:MAG TPA: methyltransferase domain-containing protein, partial [Gaiellaceae bacterium]|nr:methyltransferase domain-containing protein [Gaiellaceae bacterium]